MIPRNESPLNKRFSILGLKNWQHQMMALKLLKFECRDNNSKLRAEYVLLQPRQLRATVTERKMMHDGVWDLGRKGHFFDLDHHMLVQGMGMESVDNVFIMLLVRTRWFLDRTGRCEWIPMDRVA